MNSQRRIFVTGASSGIGRAIATELASRGHVVVASARRLELLESLAAQCTGTIFPLQLDVNSSEECAAAPDIVKNLAGEPIDVIINNAGYSAPGPLEHTTPEDLERQFRTNVFGLHAITHAFLPMLVRASAPQSRSKVINISSVMGRTTLPFHGPYNASKHAVEAMTNALRMEMRPRGIDVITIEPGFVRTQFEEIALQNMKTSLGGDRPYASAWPGIERAYRKGYKRGHSPEKIARTMIVPAVEKSRPRIRYIHRVSRIQLLADRLVSPRVTDYAKTRIGMQWKP